MNHVVLQWLPERPVLTATVVDGVCHTCGGLMRQGAYAVGDGGMKGPQAGPPDQRSWGSGIGNLAIAGDLANVVNAGCTSISTAARMIQLFDTGCLRPKESDFIAVIPNVRADDISEVVDGIRVAIDGV